MAASSFEPALALVLELEGGFVDHPRDPGGATNLGITRATLAAERGRPVSATELRALTRAEAGAIYRRRYWDVVRADDLPAGLDLLAFDEAVHSGPARAAAALQRALDVSADGRIGPRTLEAASLADPVRLVPRLCQARRARLRRLSTWPVFGRGWTARIARVEREALRLAAVHATASATVPRPDPVRMLNQEERPMTETKSIWQSRTVWANLVGLAALGLGFAGYGVAEADVRNAADAVAGLVAAVSALASIAFRVVATKQIGPGPAG